MAAVPERTRATSLCLIVHDELELRLQDHRDRLQELGRRHNGEIESAVVAHQASLDLVLSTHRHSVETAFEGALGALNGAISERSRQAGTSPR